MLKMGQWGLGACLLVSGWVLKERNVSRQHSDKDKVIARFTQFRQFVHVCSQWEMFDRVSLFAKQNMMDRKRIWKKLKQRQKSSPPAFSGGP